MTITAGPPPVSEEGGVLNQACSEEVAKVHRDSRGQGADANCAQSEGATPDELGISGVKAG